MYICTCIKYRERIGHSIQRVPAVADSEPHGRRRAPLQPAARHRLSVRGAARAHDRLGHVRAHRPEPHPGPVSLQLRHPRRPPHAPQPDAHPGRPDDRRSVLGVATVGPHVDICRPVAQALECSSNSSNNNNNSNSGVTKTWRKVVANRQQQQ